MPKIDDPMGAAPSEAVKAVAETPSKSAVDELANKIGDALGDKFVGKAELAEMFKAYKAQQAEHAQKALEGRPEEASPIDPANQFQAKDAFAWLKDQGFGVVKQDEAQEGTALKALCDGYAHVLLHGKGSVARGVESAMKAKALGQHEASVAKALGVDDFSSGGAMFTPQMSTEVVEALLSETGIVGDPGIRKDSVQGQMEYPYVSTSTTDRWVAENAAANASDASFDVVTLRPEAVRIITSISKKMLRSVPMASAAVQAELKTRLNERIDNKLIRSLGVSNTPIGLRYLAASGNVLTVQTSVSTANTEKDLLRLFQAIQAANVRLSIPQLRFLYSPRIARYLMGLRGTDVYLFKADMLAGRLLGAPIAGESSWGVSNIPENLSVTDSSESEIYLYHTGNLRVGVGEDMSLVTSDTAAYANSSGTLVSALSSNQQVFALHAEIGMVDVTRGNSIAVLSDVDWGV
jgi:HK97 family phage major capsid protein